MKITWHMGEESGDWVAKVDGEVGARAYRRHGTPSGYYAAYKLSLHGPLFIHGAVNGHYPDSLRECKEIVARRLETVEAREQAALAAALPPHPSELCEHGGRSFACQES